MREGARPLKATGNALRCFRWLRRAKMSLGIAEEVDSFSDVRDIFKTGMVVYLWCRVVFIAGLYYYNEWLCLEVIVVWPSRDSPGKTWSGSECRELVSNHICKVRGQSLRTSRDPSQDKSGIISTPLHSSTSNMFDAPLMNGVHTALLVISSIRSRTRSGILRCQKNGLECKPFPGTRPVGFKTCPAISSAA